MTAWDVRIEFVSMVQSSALQAQAKLSDTAYERVQAKCVEIGAQGWELVSCAPMTTTAGTTATHMVCAFKKPK
jgi:hypothetical protein